MVMVNLMFLLSYKPARRRTADLETRPHPQQGQDDLEEAPPVFTELLELTEYRDGVREWKEVARYVNCCGDSQHYSRQQLILLCLQMGEIPGDGGRGRESVSQYFLMVNVDSSIYEHSSIENRLVKTILMCIGARIQGWGNHG